jgi:hypothetical protein
VHKAVFAASKRNEVAVGVFNVGVNVIVVFLRPCDGNNELGLRFGVGGFVGRIDKDERKGKEGGKTQEGVEQEV